MTSPTGYSRTQIFLHWAVAGLIALQFLFPDAIEDAFRRVMKGEVYAFDPLIMGHVAAGVLVLALTLGRGAIRLRRGAPNPPETEHPLLRKAAHAAHGLLYLTALLIPVSGLVAWFGGVGPAAGAHGLLTKILLFVIAAHVAGALYHRFVLKSGVMERMLRAQR